MTKEYLKQYQASFLFAQHEQSSKWLIEESIKEWLDDNCIGWHGIDVEVQLSKSQIMAIKSQLGCARWVRQVFAIQQPHIQFELLSDAENFRSHWNS